MTTAHIGANTTMHSTIAIPNDISLHALAKALATLDLAPSAQRGRMLTFEHAPQRAETIRKRCMEPGCTHDGVIQSKGRMVCSSHYLGIQPESVHE